ncbi:MAG: anaerobic ribonucleoside-triphosphate reductase activating protein [Oscillospiraceae bacterium]|nr:anaerobic ribonucleoside-triphosphate reductase activating protein [Oscillospiraceae bacterium]
MISENQENSNKLRIAGIVEESFVDGPGIRFAVFVQGCPHRCERCHNPETHDFGGGREVDTDELFEQCLANPLINGVTFSGGEPFCQAAALYKLGCRFKESGLNLMCYSGWTFEELLEKSISEEDVKNLLSILDHLVDGRFELSQRSLQLKFRGSSNQRIIDVQRSLSENKAVTVEL